MIYLGNRYFPLYLHDRLHWEVVMDLYPAVERFYIEISQKEAGLMTLPEVEPL
jgi:hypothetical protein